MPELEMDENKLRTHIAAFESALAAREPDITELPLKRLLLALDGSNQDATALALTIHLARRTDATVLPLCAWETTAAERADYLAARFTELRQAGVAVAEVGSGADCRPPHAQILDACAAAQCDLLVIPAPFREDFAALGHESVGSQLDILLCRAPGPLLVVREPRPVADSALANILLPLTPSLPANADAAAWAIRLAEEDGTIRLLAIFDRQPEGMPATTTQTGAGTGSANPETAGLIAAVQRRAADRGLGCRVDVQQGEEVETIVTAGNAEELLVILPCCPRNPAGRTFQRVQAIIRLSRNPVLMV